MFCKGIFNRSGLIRIFRDLVEAINRSGKKISRPVADWSVFGIFFEYKRGEIHSQFFLWGVEKYSTLMEDLAPEGSEINIPAPEVAISRHTMVVVKWSEVV